MITAVQMIVFMVSCLTFLASAGFYIYVKTRLKPKDESLDDYYYQFEGKHPDVARYYRLSSISFTVAIVSMLGMFLVVFIFR